MPQDATPFALVVRFTVRPGREADSGKLVARTAAGIRAHEPGTLVYACHQVDGAPRERIFYRAALNVHQEQPHTRRFLTEREPCWSPRRLISST
jgi:quinol monooxygenase YgiN